MLGVFTGSTKWRGLNAGLPSARSMMRHSTHRRSGALQPQADGNQPLDRNHDPDGVKLQLGITQKGLTGFVVACELSDFLGSNVRVQF